jgi:hypothetical protein
MRRLAVLFVALCGCQGVVATPGGGGGGTGAGGTGGSGGTGGGLTGGDGGSVDQSGCNVLAVVNARCISCHGSPPSGGAPMSLNTLSALRAPSARDPSKSYAERAIVRMQDGVSPMPPPPNPGATADDVAVFQTWISAGLPACASSDGGVDDGGITNTESSPNLIPQDELFTCVPGTMSDATTRIRRINRWEFTRDVGGSVTRSWTGFTFYDNPFDPSGFEPYSTYATDETLDDATIDLFLPVVAAAGPPWAGPYTGDNRLQRLHDDASLQCMYMNQAPTSACIDHYLSEFLTHGVLFRPPTTDELSRLHAFTDMVLAEEDPWDGGTGPRTDSITRISNAAWLTTGALFRTELGDPAAQTRTALTAWELAQQLAYAVGRRAPGATPTYVYPTYSAPLEGHMADIADNARDGGIFDAGVVDALLREYAGGYDPTRFDLIQDYDTNRASRRGEWWLSDGIAGFFREWLGYGDVAGVFKERPEATSAFDDGGTSPYREQLSAYGNLMSGYYGYESTLLMQLDDTVARVVTADTHVLENLLTTTQFHLPASSNPGVAGAAIANTGEIYNTTAVITEDNASRWVTLPATERSGVLTHPAWLAAHGNNFEDDPSLVHRGKWVRENLLCGWVPPLSAVRVVAKVGPHDPTKNARERVLEATAGAQCQMCHSLMNPLGFPFEIYNHAGYVRLNDHAPDGGWMAPDGTTTLIDMPDPALDGPVHDALELNAKLAASPYVKRCFVRQAFRYFMGRDENRSDACTLARMEQAYDSSNGSFTSMLSALMTSDTWTTRAVGGP